MRQVHPENFHKVWIGREVHIWTPGQTGTVLAKILYIENRKNYKYDKSGNLTDDYDIVAHRLSFAPVGGLYEGRRVDSVHCFVGRFKVFIDEAL